MLTIALKKKHFGGDFNNNQDCPVARALKEKYKTRDALVRTFDARVGNETRRFDKDYTPLEPARDMKIAAQEVDPEAVIRKVAFI